MRRELRVADEKVSEGRFSRPVLLVEPNDIEFWNESPDRVMIQLTIRNLGPGPSRATEAEVQAAPLGAFLPWRPLGIMTVPPIRAGEARVVGGWTTPRPIEPFAHPERISRRRLLVATGLTDRWPLPARRSRRTEGLPADPLRLLGCGGAHWAGNLNVFLHRRPVERHRARALRIHPGKVNLALFFVGSGPDSYAFHLGGDGAAWNATLHDMPRRFGPRVPEALRESLALDSWIPVRTLRVVMLALRPAPGCHEGAVRVFVTQRSSGKVAVVEFSFDADAAGPGCYVVR